MNDKNKRLRFNVSATAWDSWTTKEWQELDY